MRVKTKRYLLITMSLLLLLAGMPISSAWADSDSPVSLDSWVKRSPLPTGNSLFGIVYGNNGFVGVGANGAIVASGNGADWTVQSSGTTRQLNSVAYGDDQYVAVGANGTIVTSGPAGSWTSQSSGTTSALMGVAYGAGTYVAAGMNNTILTSTDGVNWFSESSGTTAVFQAVAYGNDTFVAVGLNGIILTSADGKEWDLQSSGSTEILGAVTYGNGVFIVAGSNGTVLSSSNAVNWDSHASGSANRFYGVSYGEGSFVVVGSAGTIMASSDATNWNPSPNDIFPQHLHSIAYGNGRFVAVGDNGTMLSSTTGEQWGDLLSGTGETISDIVYADDTFVAVGAKGTALASADGSEWRRTLTGVTESLSGIAYGNGSFVAVACDGTIVTTANGGVSWVGQASTVTDPLNGIVYGNNTFVAVGGTIVNGTIVTSPDGSAWTSRTSNSNRMLNSVAFGNDTFVAVGMSGRVVTSTNGVEWTSAVSGTTLNGIAYGNGRFVAVGSAGTVLTSVYGENWEPQTSHTTEMLSAVTYDDRFVAVGSSGTILSSSDGVTWASHSSGSTSALYAVVSGKDSWIAAGGGGAIIQTGVPAAAPPVVTSVSVPPDGTYRVGDQLNFRVTYSDDVSVNGEPSLGLLIGTNTVQAGYVSAASFTELDFRYTVQSGDPNVTGIEVTGMNLNGGLIVCCGETPANNELRNIGDTTGIVVVGEETGNGPLSLVSLSPANGATGVSIRPTLSATFNKAIHAGGEGMIQIWKQSDSSSAVAQIGTGDASKVAITGTTAAISPQVELEYNTTYYVTMTYPFYGEGYSDNYSGFTDNQTWTFTTRSRPSGNSGTPSTPGLSEMSTSGVEILVNGKPESAGSAASKEVNGQRVTTIAIDQNKLEERLEAEGMRAVITIPYMAESDVVIGELTPVMIQSLVGKQATVVLRTERASYSIPAEQIYSNALYQQFGEDVNPEHIVIQIEIAEPQAGVVQIVQHAAAQGDFAIAIPPLDFKVRAVYGNRTVELSVFDMYIERSFVIPDGVDPDKITTGIVVEPDGTVRHVPTKVEVVDGVYYARVNSLTNSIYAVIWNSLEFNDVATHWASNAIHDMGSRMVVSGIGNGLYNPDQAITRAEFAAIVVRGLGLAPSAEASPFSDVHPSDWYNGFIQTAYRYGLISGYQDGTFRPADAITREQAMVVIAKAMKITGLRAEESAAGLANTTLAFADAATISEWALQAVADCLDTGVVKGRTDTMLAPKATITRAEVAVIVQRLLEFSDLI